MNIEIEYFRHEFHNTPEKVRSPLEIFVYDIPYFGSCGIFPPLHITNIIFKSGGCEGGMSPGATWEPFVISNIEYSELVKKIKLLEPSTIEQQARYAWIKFDFDSSFDHHTKLTNWISAVSNKHRDNYHKKIQGLSYD